MSAQPQYIEPAAGLVVRLEPSDATVTHVTVTGRDDTSPVQVQRDDRCTLCWLGAPHSEDAHRVRVGRRT